MSRDYININKKSYDFLALEYEEKYKNNEGANYFYKLIKEFVLKRRKKGF